MRQRRLGTSGLTVSTLALGTMTWGTTVGPEIARDLMRTHLEAGGNLIDTATGYAGGDSERMIGSLIGDLVPRDELVLATKSGISRRSGERVVDLSRRTLMRDLDASLARLGTDHVDLWMLHTWADDVPLAESLGVLEWAVTTGRARYVGVSNFTGWQAVLASSMLREARVPLVCDEIELSLIAPASRADTLDAAAAVGLGILAWSPLGRGVLSGKYRSGIPADSRATSREFPGFTERFLDERSVRIAEAVATAARGLEVSPTEVALAWALAQPSVASLVVGARTVSQLRTNLAADDLEIPEPLIDVLTEVSDR